MSVLINRMDIPKSCSDCPLNHDEMSCTVTGTRWRSDTMFLLGFDYTKERLHDCPIFEVQKPKTGHWEIYIISMFDGEGCRCSECGYEGMPNWNFCPNCGAKMEVKNEQTN